MKIFVTGGAGYIGSHTCIELLHAGHEVVVYDNFSNSHQECIHRVEHITGKKIVVVNGDLRNQIALRDALLGNQCEAVFHFAAFKAVEESAKIPLSYYDNNICSTIYLLRAMEECNVKCLIFSSSATVYGEPKWLPLTESHPLTATNPYARTKLIIEDMLRDIFHADNSWKIVMLRYFNPVGAHDSALIGEDPHGLPNNLMPFIAQVAVGRREKVNVWGGDYSTLDGTGVRDYIHVTDLSIGHLSALDYLNSQSAGQCLAINLGTGRGYSVLEMIFAFEKASGKKIPYNILGRRHGDIASCYANVNIAAAYLGWRAVRGIDEMCHDLWRWQSLSPNGYK
jgi:UDP-glucose 4-epimerase